MTGKRSRRSAQAEFGAQILAMFEVLDMADHRAAVRLIGKLIPTASMARELADLARACGAGKFAQAIIEAVPPAREG